MNIYKYFYIFNIFQILFCFGSEGITTQPLKGSNGNYYDVIHKPCNWVEAYEDCKSRTYRGIQGHLAVISSIEEQKKIWGNFPFPGYFLGGRQKNGLNEPNGNWIWVTGENWDFSNWDVNEPNNENNNEQYLQFSESKNGTWNDVRSTYIAKGYIIEYEKPIANSNIEYNISAFSSKKNLNATKVSMVKNNPIYIVETKTIVNNQIEIKETLKKQQDILHSHNLLLDQITKYTNTKPIINKQANITEKAFYDQLIGDINHLQLQMQNINNSIPYISSIYNLLLLLIIMFLLSLIFMKLAFFFGKNRVIMYMYNLFIYLSNKFNNIKEKLWKKTNQLNSNIQNTVKSTSADIKNEIGKLHCSTDDIKENIDKLYKIIESNHIDNTIVTNLKKTIKDIEQSTNSYDKYYKIILEKQEKFKKEQKEYTENVVLTLQKQQSEFLNNMLNNFQEQTEMLSKKIKNNHFSLNKHLEKQVHNETNKRPLRDRVLSEKKERFYEDRESQYIDSK